MMLEEAGALVLLNFARSASPLPPNAHKVLTGEDGDRDSSSSAHQTLRERRVISEVDSVTLSPRSSTKSTDCHEEHEDCHDDHKLLHEYMGMKLHMSVQSQTGYAGVDRKVEGGRIWFRAQAPRRLRHIRSHLGRFSLPELAAHAYATFLESPSTYTITDDPRRRKSAKSIPPTPGGTATAANPTTPGGKVRKPGRKLQAARASSSSSSSSSPSSKPQPM